jgi:hypothetical protein
VGAAEPSPTSLYTTASSPTAFLAVQSEKHKTGVVYKTRVICKICAECLWSLQTNVCFPHEREREREREKRICFKH